MYKMDRMGALGAMKSNDATEEPGLHRARSTAYCDY
ncbi:MAG: hypothetical protein JWQ98_1310 [Chlorobi bacterium]|nr:hypothetical protein [Chlorobiota bacterium]